MGSTNENLGAAFAGESQANRKYLFFAEKADREGHKQIARLFRAAAEAETVHARNHLKVLQGIKSTRDNLQAAMDGEKYEFTEMYPSFIKQAITDGNNKAQESFDLADKVEQIHFGLFESALGQLDRSEAVAEKSYYVCQFCGNTVEGEAPDTCPVCGAPRNMFKLVE